MVSVARAREQYRVRAEGHMEEMVGHKAVEAFWVAPMVYLVSPYLEAEQFPEE